MGNKILIYDRDSEYAGKLQEALGSDEVTVVNTELAAVRELTGGYYDLFVAGIREDRAKEGARLIDILLVEGKTHIVVPVVVLSDDQEPSFVQSCIKAGVSDYIIYPENPEDVLPRLRKVLSESGGLGEMLVRVATTFLGPAAGLFIEKQAKERLSVPTLKSLHRDHLPEFFSYLAVSVQPILKEKVVQFIGRLEQVFGVRRQP